MIRTTTDSYTILIISQLIQYQKNNYLTDLNLVLDSGVISIHKALACLFLPKLKNILAQHSPSEDVTLIIPNVSLEKVTLAVEEMYLSGQVAKLSNILDISCGEHQKSSFEVYRSCETNWTLSNNTSLSGLQYSTKVPSSSDSNCHHCPGHDPMNPNYKSSHFVNNQTGQYKIRKGGGQGLPEVPETPEVATEAAGNAGSGQQVRRKRRKRPPRPPETPEMKQSIYYGTPHSVCDICGVKCFNHIRLNKHKMTFHKGYMWKRGFLG